MNSASIKPIRRRTRVACAPIRTLTIGGEVAKPLTLDHDDLTKRFPLEERIYRMRCVEAVDGGPQVGFPLHKLLALVEPTSSARYVAFKTLYAPDQMPGQKDRFIGGARLPLRGGLRLDEAMHPLTLLTVGVYGKALPPQNGAPVRLTVPWKYGFKGIKSIVSIELTRERPPTTGTGGAGRIRLLRQRQSASITPLVAGWRAVYRRRRRARCEASTDVAV